MATKTKKRSAKKTGLRTPQVRVLQTLSKSDKALNRSEISAKGKVDVASLTEYIGSDDPKTRAKNDKKWGFTSLISLGFVKSAEKDGRSTYTITAAVRKALEPATKQPRRDCDLETPRPNQPGFFVALGWAFSCAAR